MDDARLIKFPLPCPSLHSPKSELKILISNLDLCSDLGRVPNGRVGLVRGLNQNKICPILNTAKYLVDQAAQK